MPPKSQRVQSAARLNRRDLPKPNQAAENRERILKLLAKGPHTEPEIRATLGIPKGQLRYALKHLTGDAWMVNGKPGPSVNGGKNPGPILYELKDDLLATMPKPRQGRRAGYEFPPNSHARGSRVA